MKIVFASQDALEKHMGINPKPEGVMRVNKATNRLIERLTSQLRYIHGDQAVPCPYYVRCSEACAREKADHCDTYKRLERIARIGEYSRENC